MDDPKHLTPHAFRELGYRVVDRIADYMEDVAELPVASRCGPGDILEQLPQEAPVRSESWDDILADVERIIMPGLMHWQSPGFFGYFPANASGPAILGELLSAGLGVQGMLWSTSPAATELETRMMDWLARALGLPNLFLSQPGPGGGVIQGTASEAVLVSLLAARERACRAGADASQLDVFASVEAHSSVTKAARIAGLAAGVRLVSVDGALRMDPEALDAAMAASRRDGRVPCFVCATLGTTSSTAIDPLRAVATVAREHGAWVHVDMAFLGAAAVCPELREFLDGIELADAVNTNPHKWLLTSFDCSALWVRDREPLVAALSITPEYLRNRASDAGAVIDYRDWQVPLGRRFRALKLWFVMRHYGIEGLQAHIRRGTQDAGWFEQQVLAHPQFELAAPRTSSLVCFRVIDADPAMQDARNRALLEALNATGAVFLSHTTLPAADARGRLTGDRRFTLRLAVGAVATERHHVERAWSLMCSLVGEDP